VRHANVSHANLEKCLIKLLVIKEKIVPCAMEKALLMIVHLINLDFK
jgi:hypothetical protein